MTEFEIFCQDRIIERMAGRLNTPGQTVKTGEVWEICPDMSYPMVCRQFKFIMDTMVEQGKAVKLKRGTWKVLKANERRA